MSVSIYNQSPASVTVENDGVPTVTVTVAGGLSNPAYNLSPDERAALDAANSPNADNPIATIADITDGTAELTADELAAVQGASTPSATNVFATLSDANLSTVSIQSGNYLLTTTDSVVVFTATATATLAPTTGSGRTYRLVCRAGTLTIGADGTDIIKGETTAVLSPGEDLILTDTETGVWE